MNIAGYRWILSLAIGTSLGIGIGAAIDHIGVGVAICVGGGVAVGFFLYRQFYKTASDD